MIGEGKGWICLYRSIQDHWLWEDPIKLKWWLDILLLVNHKGNKFLLGNELIEVKVGEHYTSILKLADRWGVDRKTVKKFLELLEKDNMISLKISNKGTTLKVSNYNAYQSISSSSSPNKKDNEVPAKRTTESQQSPTNNNENNENNVNNENNSVCLGEFENVYLEKEEYEKLINTHTQSVTNKYIEKLSLYMESEGKRYNSHYATIKKWIREDEEKKPLSKPPTNVQAISDFKKKDEYGHNMGEIRKQLLGL